MTAVRATCLGVGFVAALAQTASAGEVQAPRWAGIAVPLVAYDSNLGVGGGAYGQVVIADPEGIRPYRASIDAQVYLTTAGFQDHYLGWDLPGAFGSRVRWDMRLRYQSWTEAPYYGMGNHTPRPEPGSVPDDWNQWSSRRPFALSHVRVPVADSPVELYVGVLMSWLDVTAPADTMLALDQPLGIEGGAAGSLKLGVFRDTRTDEIDPLDGTAVDVAVRVALPRPLSAYQFVGMHASARGWWSPVPWFVAAGHVLVDTQTPGGAFFDQAYFGGLARTGIGGRYLLRGLAEERLRGDGIVASQAEGRFRLGEFTVLKKVTLGWTLAGFMDVGRVWTWDEPAPFRVAPHVTGGAGVRINLNGLLVMRADLGLAAERYELAPRQRGQVQFYMLAAQPF